MADTFEVITQEWFAKHCANLVNYHSERVMRRFERDVFPWIGERPIAEIKAPELLSVIRRIESRRAIEAVHRALNRCGQVSRYAVATAQAERDLSGDLRGAIPPAKGEHFAATTDPRRFGEIPRAMDGYESTLIVKCALRLAPWVYMRPGELRKAEWADVDLESAEWRYHVTKTQTQHIVPLCSQAVAILREMKPLTGKGRYLFPSARTSARPMSDNATLAALRRMSIGKEEMTCHGFRAIARTIQDEGLGVRPDFIEYQLGPVNTT